MDSNRLRYFCTVVKTGNLHKAADILHISVPALSKSIKVLEGDLNKKLLVQIGRGIAVTDEGRKVAEQAQKILSEIDLLFKSDSSHQFREILRIGSFEVFTTHFIGPFVKQHLGDVSLELHELIPGQLEHALVQRKIDLGITYIPIPHPDLDFLKIAKIRMEIFGKKDVFKNFSFRELPFAVPIAPVEGSPNKIKGLDGWPDDRIPRNQKYKVTLMESALELCRQGIAVAYLPTFIVALHNQTVIPPLRLYPISEPKKSQFQEVYLLKRRSDVEGSTVKKVAKILRVLCKVDDHNVQTETPK